MRKLDFCQCENKGARHELCSNCKSRVGRVSEPEDVAASDPSMYPHTYKSPVAKPLGPTGNK